MPPRVVELWFNLRVREGNDVYQPNNTVLALGNRVAMGMWEGVNEAYLMPALRRALRDTRPLDHHAVEPPKFFHLGMVTADYIFETKVTRH